MHGVGRREELLGDFVSAAVLLKNVAHALNAALRTYGTAAEVFIPLLRGGRAEQLRLLISVVLELYDVVAAVAGEVHDDAIEYGKNPSERPGGEQRDQRNSSDRV